jgi:hypothetical protein
MPRYHSGALILYCVLYKRVPGSAAIVGPWIAACVRRRVGIGSGPVSLIRQAKEHRTYARVTTGQVQPGTIDDLMPFYDSAAQQQKAMQGFVSTQLLIDRAANRWVVVTVFETLADLEASEMVPRQTMADPRVGAALAGAPVIGVD